MVCLMCLSSSQESGGDTGAADGLQAASSPDPSPETPQPPPAADGVPHPQAVVEAPDDGAPKVQVRCAAGWFPIGL